MEWEENKMNCMEDFLKEIVNEMKKDIFGTRGQQIGGLASQADMLADDWYEVENNG